MATENDKRPPQPRKCICCQAGSRTGFVRKCGKVALITASYQIFAVGMNAASAQDMPPELKWGASSLRTMTDRNSPSFIHHQTPGKSSLLACIGCTSGPDNVPCGGTGSNCSCTGCVGCNVCQGCTQALIQEMENTAVRLNAQGLQYDANGQWELAVQTLTAALQNWPNNDVIRDNLAQAQAQLQQQRNQASNLDQQGQRCFNNGQWQLAIDAFSAALQNWPSNAAFREHLLRAQDELRKQVEYNHLAGTLKLTPGALNNPQSLQPKLSGTAPQGLQPKLSGTPPPPGDLPLKLGDDAKPPTASGALAAWKSQDLPAAAQAYRTLIESSSGNPEYAASLRLLLAQVLLAQGDYAGAAREFEEARRVTPDAPMVRTVQATLAADPAGAKALADAQQGNGAAPATAAGTPGATPGTLQPFPVTPGKVSSGTLYTPDEILKTTPFGLSQQPDRLHLTGIKPEWSPKVTNDPTFQAAQTELTKREDELKKLDEQGRTMYAEYDKLQKTGADPDRQAELLKQLKPVVDAYKAQEEVVVKQKEEMKKLARKIDSEREGSDAGTDDQNKAP